MPLCLSDKKYVIVLKSDQGLPPDKQPKFYFRYLSAKAFFVLAKVYDSIGENSSAKTLIRDIYDTLRTHLTGWENLIGTDGKKVNFAPNKLEELLSLTESMEIIVRLLDQRPETSANFQPEKPEPGSLAAMAQAGSDAFKDGIKTGDNRRQSKKTTDSNGLKL